MGANEFDEPRVASVYDVFDSDRSDLDLYVEIVEELGASSVLDLGCGTGALAIMLAGSGRDVAGVDPAGAMLDVARAKPGADRVQWIHGDATAVPRELSVDVVTLTGNAAQAIIDDADWRRTLEAVRGALVPGGHFVFETREPSLRAWESWTRNESFTMVDGIESWEEVTGVVWPLVTFDSTTVFPDGTTWSRPRRSVFASARRSKPIFGRPGSSWWMCVMLPTVPVESSSSLPVPA